MNQQTNKISEDGLRKIQKEIELLWLRAIFNEEKFKMLDKELEFEISKYCEGTPIKKITRLWRKACEYEELISFQL